MYKNDAFNLGESFHRVACSIFPEDLFDESDDGHWFVPYIVNLSFACELYLKSLFSDGESETRGHCLDVLYNQLSDEQKNLILNRPEFKGDKDFISNITRYNRMFEKWRYCFEAGKSREVDIVFLENLAIVLHDVAKDEL